MSELTTNLCATKWTINGTLKSTFKKQINKNGFMAWNYLNLIKCIESEKIKIHRIKLPYFIGLNKDEIKKYKKEYNKYGSKGVLYYRYDKEEKDYVYIFKDIKFFNKYMYLRNEINKNDEYILKKISKNKIFNYLKFKNTETKYNFIYNILSDIIKNNNYKNIKILLKFTYYKQNFLNDKNIIFDSYDDLYKKLKIKGIEKKFNDNFKEIYKLCLNEIKKIKIDKIKSYNVKPIKV